jgi:hypothetical protein
VLDELGAGSLGGGDGPRVGVGEQRDRRIAERDVGQDTAHPVGGTGHQRGVGRHRHGQDDGALGTERPGELRAGLDGRPVAGDDDLAGGVPVGHDERPVCRGPSDQLGEPHVVKPDERRHRSVGALSGGLHLATALADQADAVAEVDDAGGHEGGVLAHRVARGEGGGRRRRVRARPALAHRLKDGDRRGEDRRLGVLGQVESFNGAVPGECAERLAEGRVGGSEHRGGGRGGRGEVPAHAHRLRALAGKDEGERRHHQPA